MPLAPSRPCRHPGCPALVAAGPYCDQHKRAPAERHRVYDRHKRAVDPSLAQSAKIRSGAQWQGVRAIHKQLEPICCDPYQMHPDQPRWNEQSHHIVPLHEAPALAYDLDNLAPLCTACHAEVERRERRGEVTREVVRGAKGRSKITT